MAVPVPGAAHVPVRKLDISVLLTSAKLMARARGLDYLEAAELLHCVLHELVLRAGRKQGLDLLAEENPVFYDLHLVFWSSISHWSLGSVVTARGRRGRHFELLERKGRHLLLRPPFNGHNVEVYLEDVFLFGLLLLFLLPDGGNLLLHLHLAAEVSGDQLLADEHDADEGQAGYEEQEEEHPPGRHPRGQFPERRWLKHGGLVRELRGGAVVSAVALGTGTVVKGLEAVQVIVALTADGRGIRERKFVG